MASADPYVTNARNVLLFWLEALTPTAIRSVEVPLPATLPDGSRLRGIQLASDVFLSRDLKLYRATQEKVGELVEVFVDELAEDSRVQAIAVALERVADRAIDRSDARRSSRRIVARSS